MTVKACDPGVTLVTRLTGKPLNPPGPNYAYLPGNLGPPDGASWQSFGDAPWTVD